MIRKQPSKKKSAAPRRRRRLLLAVGIPLALLLLAVILILGSPRHYRIDPIPSPEEAQLIYQVMERTSQAVVDENGDLAECMEITLDADEINALLRAALRVAQRNRTDSDPSFAADWSDGALHLQVSIPFGIAAINAETRAVPSVAEAQAQLKLSSVWLGSLPVPAFAIQGVTDRELAKVNADGQVKSALAVFESVTVMPDGRLRIRVLPANLSQFLSLLVAGEPAS